MAALLLSLAFGACAAASTLGNLVVQNSCDYNVYVDAVAGDTAPCDGSTSRLCFEHVVLLTSIAENLSRFG